MAIEFISDRKEGVGKACWSYRCTGLHEGPPIICYVHNPRPEYDEGYVSVDYDKIEWDMPEGVSFPNAVGGPNCTALDDLEGLADDFYWDVEIREDIREALMH